jgi:cytochrome P450
MVRQLSELPHPKGIPFFGNFWQVPPDNMHGKFEEWAREFGDYYTLQLGPQRVLVISELESSLQIFKERPHQFQRTQKMQTVFHELGVNGVFAAEGDAWMKQRKLVMQALNLQKIKRFLPDLEKVVARLEQKWMGYAQKQEVFSPLPDLMSFTIDVTTQFAFGYDAKALEDQQHSIRRQVEFIFPLINRRLRAIVPYWRYFKFPSDRAVDVAIQELRQLTAELVSAFEQRSMGKAQIEPENFLEALCVAAKDQAMALTDSEVFANVLTMLLAGEDTTANVAAWACYFLAMHPEIQKNIRAEMQEVLGSRGVIENWQQLEKLKYTEGVAMEALRVKSAAPVVFFQPTEDTIISDIVVPKDVVVFVLTRYLGMKSQYFHQPGMFNPLRWCDTPEMAEVQASQKAFLPFGSGPRFCPGRHLSLVELKYLLVMWVRKFELFLPDDALPPYEQFNFTMRPEGLQIGLRALTS